MENPDPPISSRVEIPDAVHGWTLVTVDSDAVEWWKTGSTHISADYQKLRVSLSSSIGDREPQWRVRESSIDEYGNSVSSKQLFQKRELIEDYDYGEWAIQRAKRHMEKHPGNDAFDEKPSIPEEIGRWECSESGLQAWEWESPHAEIRVEQSDIQEGYCKTSVRYTTTVSVESGDFVVADGTVSGQAIRAAVRCVESIPNGYVDEEWSELENIRGVGPAKATKFRALGLTSREDLRDAIQSEFPNTDPEFSRQLEIVLTTMIRDELAETEAAPGEEDEIAASH